MNCQEVRKHWEEWLAGRAAAGFDQHLRDCADCRLQAGELARASSWVGLLREEPFEPAADFWARLRSRLEEQSATAAFWEALTWAAARASLALAVLVFLFTVGILLQPPAPAAAVREFDAPQSYLEEATGATVSNGELDRDQVVMTLVAYTEAPQ